MGVRPLPGQRQGDESGVARGRFDRVAAPPGFRAAELERAGRLHRASPHVDRLVEDPGDHGHGVEPQVPPDRGVVQTRGQEHGRAAERAGGHDHLRCSDDEPPRQRSERIAVRTRERLSGVRIRPEDIRLDPRGSAAFDQDPGHASSLHDPGAGCVSRREMCADPGLLRPSRASERTATAVAAVRRVPPRRRRLPAQLRRAAQDHLVLWRDDGRRSNAERRPPPPPGRRQTPVRRCRPVRGRAAHSARTSSGTGILVIQFTTRPAADCRAREHRDRAVPGREESVIQIEPPVGVQLICGQGRLVDERPGLDDHDRPPREGQLRGRGAATRPGPDDDDIRIERDRLVAVRPE